MRPVRKVPCGEGKKIKHGGLNGTLNLWNLFISFSTGIFYFNTNLLTINVYGVKQSRNDLINANVRLNRCI